VERIYQKTTSGSEVALSGAPRQADRDQPGEWDSALAALVSPAPLLQSWGWGEVYRSLGWRPEHVRLPSGGRALVLVRGTWPLRWGYAPRGPVPATLETAIELADWARSERLAMLRIEPEGPVELREQLREAGFRPGRSIEPRHSAIVRLQDPEAMLASFRRTTRYNIRLAERQGVAVDKVAGTEELIRQIQATADRHRVRPEGRAYLRALTECLPDVHLYVARHEGVALAANLVIRHDRRSYYLLAGSNGLRRELKPNYALLWRALCDAHATGCVDYDLYGMPPPDDPTHPWHGLSEFKNGFSGSPVEYTGTWEIALSPTASRVLKVGQRTRRRAERVALRLRLAIGRPGQSPERAGTSPPLATAEPMASEPEHDLNS
jgi:hypothetical protein